MIGGPQQQAMVPFQGGFGGFGGGGMSPSGFGQTMGFGQSMGSGQSMGFGQFGGDPMGVNNNMMALGQQQAQWSNMMTQMMDVMGMMFNMFMMKQMQTMMSSMANFGGGGTSGGSPGVDNFLGGSNGASGASGGGGGGGAAPVGGSSAPAATSSDFGSVPGWGTALAKDAEKNANGPGGWCFRWVRQALERAGVKGVGGASAYMAADQLAKNPKFREISVQPKDLKKLPAGAVVVWNRGNGHEHGHISIALGDGREASDKIRTQTTNYGTSVRVFLPK